MENYCTAAAIITESILRFRQLLLSRDKVFSLGISVRLKDTKKLSLESVPTHLENRPLTPEYVLQGDLFGRLGCWRNILHS